jgi:hypothetical protein
MKARLNPVSGSLSVHFQAIVPGCPRISSSVARVHQPMLGAIAAEVRRIREQMDDALDGQAGRWACGSDLTPDNRHNIR